MKTLSLSGVLALLSLTQGSESAEIDRRPRYLAGIEDVVDCLAFSGDGTRIAAGCNDGSLSIWDASTGLPIRTIKKSGGPVVALALDADGSRLAISSRVRFHVTNRAQKGPLGTGQGGKSLSARGSQLLIRSVKTGEVLHTLVKDESSTHSTIKSLAFDTDNGQLSAVDPNDLFTAWDTSTGKRVLYMDKGQFAGQPPANRLVAAFDGSGLRAAMVDQWGPVGRVKVWDAFGASVRSYDCESDTIRLLAVRRDGRCLAIATCHHRVSVWEFATGRRVCRCAWDHTVPPASLQFSQDGRLLASGGDDGKIRIWDARDGRLLRAIEGPTRDRVRQIVFLPGKLRAASGGEHKNPEERDQRTCRLKIAPLVVWDLDQPPDRLAKPAR